MWWCGRDVWGAGLSSFPSAGGVVSWGHGCGWVTGRILSEGLPAMSPGRVGVFGRILAVAFSLLASGGLCRVLGDTPAVGVTGRTASEGLPGVSPEGVRWLMGRFSLLSFRFWLRRVGSRLGDTAVVGLRAEFCRRVCSPCPRGEWVFLGGILAVAFSLLASASGFGGLCRVLGTRLWLGYGPNFVGGSARHVPGESGCFWGDSRCCLFASGFGFWLLRVVSRLGGHPCRWGYGPNCVGRSARSVPERVLWLRGPKRHSPVRTPSRFPCSKPPKTRSGRRVAVGGGGCRSRRRTWPGWRCLRRLE